MATVTTSFAPEPQMFAYVTETGDVLDRTNLPRAEIIHSVVAGAVPASGVGDDQVVAISFNLPQNFTYVMVDCYAAIVGVDAGNWSATALGTNIQSDLPLFQTWFELTSTGVTGINATSLARAYNAPRLPRGLMRGATSGANASITMRNAIVNSSAMTVNVYTRFLMFDVDQFHNVLVNTPQLQR